MAKGFEIETALGAPFAVAKRRPVTVFAWGVLVLLPFAPMFAITIPIMAAAAESGSKIDPEAVNEMVALNVFANLAQLLQYVTGTLVTAAVIRAVMAGPKARSKAPFFLGFGMSELMVAVSTIAIALMIYGLVLVLGLIGVALGFAVWSVGEPWNVLIIVGYGAAALIGVLWLCLRLSLVVVASADRRTLELQAAWAATKGQVWKTVLLMILCWLASLAVMLIFAAIALPIGLGAAFASGIHTMDGDWSALTLQQAWPLIAGGVAIFLLGGWVVGLSQVLFTGALASVWQQLTRRTPKPADAAPEDALTSPEL